MAAPKNVGKRDTGTREKLLNAAADIMLAEGYAAATSRKVADKVGVQRAVVHYYFPTMDDLYLAVLQRGTQASLDAQRRALTSGRPLQALWDLTVDERGVSLLMEFIALGNHREVIRRELSAGAERFREAQVTALTVLLKDLDDSAALPAEVISVLIASIGRMLTIESALGITTGHHSTREFVGELLQRFEPPAATS